jgi:hypothetical protein
MQKLKASIASLDEVPDVLRDYYRRVNDSAYALVIEGEPVGYELASKVGEFRANNRALNAKVTELETANAELVASLDAHTGTDVATLMEQLRAFEGIDPAEYHALKALTPRVTELESALATERQTLARTQFSSAVAAELHKSGIRTSAVEFMTAEAAKVFALKDGALSTDTFSPTKPGERLSLAEWVAGQRVTASYAFQPSSGGGAPIGGSTGSREPRTVSRDPGEFGQNLAAIASGEAVVR